MSTSPRNLHTPNFSGPWCQSDGTLTPLALTTIRRLWERTGNAPGVDTPWLATNADQSTLSTAAVQSDVKQARETAQQAASLALCLMEEVAQLRAQLQKALETSEEHAIVTATDRRRV